VSASACPSATPSASLSALPSACSSPTLRAPTAREETPGKKLAARLDAEAAAAGGGWADVLPQATAPH
jgi:hypothetical protein